MTCPQASASWAGTQERQQVPHDTCRKHVTVCNQPRQCVQYAWPLLGKSSIMADHGHIKNHSFLFVPEVHMSPFRRAAVMQMHAQRHGQRLSSALPPRHGHERVCEGCSFSAADASRGPARCLRWRACALHLEYGHALLSSCPVPRAGPLVGHGLPKRGWAACSKVELGRLRWQAACAGSQVPLQLLCIVAERAHGCCLHWRALPSTICSVAPCMPCFAMQNEFRAVHVPPGTVPSTPHHMNSQQCAEASAALCAFLDTTLHRPLRSQIQSYQSSARLRPLGPIPNAV